MKTTFTFFAAVFALTSFSQVCFSPATTFSAGASPKSVCKADFNGDSKLDLAVANGGANNVSVLLGTGTGSFGTATNFTVGALPFFVISADFNSDGKADLATANYGSGNVAILLGTGTGSFGAATNFTASTSGLYCVISADFNGDGKVDLAAGDNGANGVAILLGTGTGSFNTAVNFATAGNNVRSICSGDFNGDGKADLATDGGGSNLVAVLLGTGTGSFTPANTFATGTSNSSVISGDFNGDGKVDLAVSNNGSNNVSILLGNGTGNFSAPTNFGVGFGSSQPQSVISADFNSDGKIDLATANNGTSDASAILGTGTGSFGTSNDFTVGISAAPNQIISGDFNGDSKPDLAVANYNNNNVAILLNTAPSIVAVSNSTLLCVGQVATLTASGANTFTWSPSGTIAASIVVSPTINTTYSVVGTNTANGCQGGITITQTVSACTGISNYTAGQNNGLKVYPNPSNAEFTISGEKDLTLTIINQLGQVVQTIYLTDKNNHQISVTNLTSGIYFIFGNNGATTIKEKIVVAN